MKDYKKILEGVVNIINATEKSDIGFADIRAYIGENCPELKESEDEKVEKAIFAMVYDSDNELWSSYGVSKGDVLAWLEKQGEIDGSIKWHSVLKEPEEMRELLCEWDSDDSTWHEVAFYHSGNKTFWNGERQVENVTKWCYIDELFEKQGEQKSLYIRFGDIPNNEKSKIYRGEEEIGEENGVSVYPAFESNGDIVIGLTLPITRTSLHTQQHLLEYDNRPCYLVSGDCVGKGTDGEPLIRNICIIKQLNNYRIKETEKQGEQKPFDYENANIPQKEFAPKVEPKFHEGDWVIFNGLRLFIKEVVQGYYRTISLGGIPNSYDWDIDNVARLWTLDDVRDGDVLVNGSNIFIFHFINDTRLMGYCHINTDDGRFYDDIGKNECFCLIDAVVNPATKEQHEQLEKAMADAGYTFDFEKKELKKIKKDSAWSEEDERKLAESIALIRSNNTGTFYYEKDELSSFLKSLKDRVGSFDDGYKVGFSAAKHNQWKPSEDQIEALASIVDGLAKNCGEECAFDLRTLQEQLKKLREE